ncbi:helix-hairpin-helix domain-containing protein [Streptomyces althioticus]|uniref:helix-hairpin-helix domain-containing protein n=1 Tax=Streptomyces althioticus TaxID=83380 RepID=UPI0036A6AF91
MPPRPRRRVVVVDRQGGAGHVLLTGPRSTGGWRRGSAGERTPELKRLPDRTGALSVAGPGGGADAARPGRFLGVGPEGEEPATYPVRLSTAHPLPTARPGDTAASADPADRETPDGVPEPEPPPGSPPGRFGPALRERLPLWVQARCGLERRSVVALAALLALALVLAVQHFWTGRTQPVRAPEVVRAAPAAQREGTDGGRDPSAAPGSFGQAGGTAAPEIVVDVSGKVRDPGVHRLPAGSRVEDALKAAGGVRPGTKTDGLNRARFLVDGEQLTVGGPAPAAAAAPAGTGAAAGPTAPVSLNTATVDQLDTLPGVGPVLAQHILDYRTRNGGFRSVDELREVNGIGDRRFADLRDLVRP